MGYFKVSLKKEIGDIDRLANIIARDGWMDSNTTIVVCSPEYSSIVCQLLNHKLSYLNHHEPFDMEFLEMPYPNEQRLTQTEYRAECRKLVSRLIKKDGKYLLVDSGVLRGTNFTVLNQEMNYFIAPERLKFASLYMQDDSKFTPDYLVQAFNFKEDGGLLFWWENEDNPLWPW